MVAFREINSRVERSANAVYSLANSETNCLQLLPCGTLNKFLLQCTTISYESFNSPENDSESLEPCGSATGIGISTGTVTGSSADYDWSLWNDCRWSGQHCQDPER